MNSHEQFAALLDAFLDGALTEAEAGRVRAHLATCPECQAYVTDALTMRELFPGIEETIVPDGFAETVLSGLPPQNAPAQTRDNLTQTRDNLTQARNVRPGAQARNVRRQRLWTKIAVPLAACVTLALLVGGIWRGLPMNRGMSGGAADMSASSEIMTQNATVTAAGADDFTGESAPDMDEAVTEGAPDMDEAVTEGAPDMDEAVTEGASDLDKAVLESAPDMDGVVMESAPEFDEATAGSASDMDGGAAYSVKSAASDSGAIGNDTDDATAQNGAARKRSYETPEAEENAPFDFGMTAPTIYEYAAPSPETPYSADTVPTQKKTADSADTMPPQSVESVPVTPRDSESDAATPRDSESDAAPAPEPDERQRASGSASAESVPAETESGAVSYWRLSPDAAPELEQFPVSEKTASGVWYALNPEQFDALRERLPESAFTPMDADSLADNPPPARDRAPVYLFLPFS